MLLLLSSVTVLLAHSVSATSLHRQQALDRLESARANPEEEFRSWTTEHEKAYVADDVEYAKRFDIWRKNLDYVVDYNSQHTTHWLGLNVHADLTNEEFKERRLGFDFDAAKNSPRQLAPLHASNEDLEDVPESLDWRDHGVVTEVKNQQQCGSCWAFSTTGAIEGINAIFTGDLISLSEQELIDCDVGIDHGCHGGLMDHAFAWVIQNGGIDTEEDYKYTAQDGKCKVKREHRHVVTIDSYMDVPPKSPKELLKAVSKQPVAIAIQANQLPFQLYDGGVLTSNCGVSLDHGVLITGYGVENGTDFWLVKNSWGPKWGDAGYIKIARNMTEGSPNMCGVTMLPSFPVKTHPNPPTPPPIPPEPPVPPPAPPTPPPPTPPPVKCDKYVSCPGTSTCCCLLEYSGQCFQWACCPLEHAVCCSDHIHCCPSTLPVCDVAHGRCLKGGGAADVSGAMLWDASESVPWVKKLPAFASEQGGLQETLQQH